MALKKLVFNKDTNIVSVYPEDTEIKPVDLLGVFIHEDNIDSFSSVKYPVLRQHVWKLLQEIKDVDLALVEIEPGYDAPPDSEGSVLLSEESGEQLNTEEDE